MEEKQTTRSSRVRKEKPSQIPIAILLLVGIVLFGFYLREPKLVLYWIFGISFGIILQRSRFCFTAAFRDPVLTGSTSITRSVLLGLGLSSIGFGALKYMSGDNTKLLTAGIDPISILLVIGAILFGIGMVIAGGCASGTLMRFGEGFEMQWLSFVFFVTGSGIGAWSMNYLEPMMKDYSVKVFLPDIFGWVGAFVVQFLIMLVIYIIAVRWQVKKLGSAE